MDNALDQQQRLDGQPSGFAQTSLLPPLTSARLNLQIDQLIRQVNHLRDQLAKVEAEELAQAKAIIAAAAGDTSP